MLVRPKGDNGCEQVSDRPTYIYLIGKESIPVELIVGPLGSQVNNKRAIKTACCDWLPKIPYARNDTLNSSVSFEPRFRCAVVGSWQRLGIREERHSHS